MTTSPWIWDDSHIDDDAILYRRVPRKFDPIVLDLSTGEQVLNPAALQYDRRDGMSTQRDELLESCYGFTVSDVCADWTTHGVAQFRAQDVRHVPDCPAGVHDEIDPDDGRIGLAHALVRCPDQDTGHHKTHWKPVQAAIARAATWLDE